MGSAELFETQHSSANGGVNTSEGFDGHHEVRCPVGVAIGNVPVQCDGLGARRS